MISVEGWTTIRYLHAQGVGVRTIAKKLGLSRNTVRRAVRAEDLPPRTRAKRRNPHLEPFVAPIATMLFEQEYIGSRILRELRRLGYSGGQTALYDYLAELKEQRTRERASVRYETAPGVQAQFDWAVYRILLGQSVRRVVVFGLILGYSRRKYYLASLDETQASAFEALERGLAHFGGAPQQLLVDNARVFVDDARPASFQWNARFLELCGHYRMEPRACAVRRPQTKGKIERPFSYLEEQLLKGAQWADLAALNAALARFMAEDLDVVVHGTTQDRPLDRFVAEENVLLPLPATRCVSRHAEVRKVSLDCLVSYGGSRYSVPLRYAGAQVWVRAALGTHVEIADLHGEVVARHAVAAKKGLTVLEQEHAAGARQRTPLTTPVLSAAFLARFPEHHLFLEGLVAQHRLAPAPALRAILELMAIYTEEALRSAFSAAVTHASCTPQFVRGLLEHAPARADQPARLGSSLPALPATPAPRSLQVYQDVLVGRPS